MTKNRISILLQCGLTMLLFACSIKAPQIVVTGEKTALENQAIGQFQHLADENSVIASTRSIDPLPAKETVGNSLDAVSSQRFRRDEINELKHEKVAGEGNDGYLAILPNDRYRQESAYRERVDRLVQDENLDRRTIYNQLLLFSTTAEAASDSIARVKLAKMNADDSEPGVMIQKPNGEWVEKDRQ
ncbi:MAG TPA: DUF1318 domain-containing protein [bacterium]|jgi:uncharacterized protein YdbL (DUF1318 family)|nr:DUF1318 domain-containing protein [bacterium]HPG45083.1 DUF1318 domain-containing protein [bacterium]HPM97325.1 DUF1318 domain-containing protein [bacterium]